MAMSYKEARVLLDMQDRNIRKVDGLRMVDGDYEYRVTYFGWFAAYVGIDRRLIGKRNFKYFGGISAADCMTVQQVIDKVGAKIRRKGQ